ncbi:MAG: hypothetical protein RIQ93_1286 [Verrucomicrobiota bacterium]|jgi:hypothetical protein
MSWHRKNPRFAFALLIAAILAVGECVWIYERYAAARNLAAKREQKRGELQALRELTPAPTREVAAAIEAELSRAQASLATMQAGLKGKGPLVEQMHQARRPAARTDAFFDLATFVEKTRELARKSGVEVRPEAARFGFSAYANEGPETDRIEAVFRQRQVAQYLTEALIEAGPKALIAVKRERPLTKIEREQRNVIPVPGADNPPPADVALDDGEDGPDFFSLNPRIIVRRPGFVDSFAFRYVFVAQTAALRSFLNRLATLELPVLVREVEVEPASAEDAQTPASYEEASAESAPLAASIVLTADAGSVAKKTSAVSAALPIVTRPLSRFTLTVEFIELVPPPSAKDAVATPPEPTR